MFRSIKIIFLLLLMVFISCDRSDGSDNTVYFFGDSHVHKWKLNNYLPDYSPENHGVSGSRITDLISDLSGVSEKKSRAVIIIGTNDLVACLAGEDSVSGILQSYRDMVALCLTKFDKVWLVNLFPLGENYSDYQAYQTIYSTLRSGFSDIIREQDNMYLVDISDQLSDGGFLSNTYSQDGVHLNNYGYQILSSAVRKAISENY